MKSLVEYVVKNIVEFPDEVSIEESSLPQPGTGRLLTIKVNDKDKGKVIGKQGVIIKSLRLIVLAGSVKKGEKYRVEISD